MSITPSVAQKKTNTSTPMRRSHTRATEGEGLETETGTGTIGMDASVGDFSSPTLVESLAKGSLGSEIIARVVVSKAAGWARDRFASPAQMSNPLGAFYDFRA
jgi:hypothetical protein